jgi:hypothetical protein
MPTDELIIGVFCMIDVELADVKKHPQAKLYPSVHYRTESLC